MVKKIAVAQDASGIVRSMTEPGRMAVYERGDENWVVADAFSFESKDGMAGMRFALGSLAARLHECRILVSKKAEGIAYQELNRLGFHLFEADQVNDAVLDGILQDIRDVEKAEAPVIYKTPHSIKQDGHFFLDLAALQEAYPDISSKKAFRAFLENEQFLSFTLVCAHLPPWVDEVIKRRGLIMREEQGPAGATKATFTFLP